MVPEKVRVVDRCYDMLRELYGSSGAPLVSVNFSKEFYLKNKYYDVMVTANVEDIEGVSFIVMLTVAQVFLSTFDLIEGVHNLMCYEVPSVEEFQKVATPIHDNMEKFLHDSIMASIENARKLDEPKEWIPELRPHINEMITEKYKKTMSDLRDIGHDCSNCHIYQNKKECEIWNAIPKPFND